jgi:fluoroacetyl-CoA thioesterase
VAGDRRCRFGSAASTVSVPDVDLPAGLRGEASLVVTEADTARSLGSGTVDVLGTPRLLALCEHATCSALDGQLPEGSTSVGMRIQVDHLQPTPVGAEVTAEAVLDKVEGRRVVFTVSASDRGGLVAAGKVTRAVVDLERFMSRCCAPEGPAA